MANMNMVPKKMAPPYLLYTLITGELPGQVPLNKLRIIYLLGVGRDSSVGTVTTLQAGSIPSRDKRFSSSPAKCPSTPALTPTPASYPMTIGRSYPGG